MNLDQIALRIIEDHSGKRRGAQLINIISESGLYSLIFRS